ncbi:MAG: hypothetical protein ABW217_17140 [Polyangiaceae bacterium]
MKVVSVSVLPGRYQLVGDGANPSLIGITVALDTTPPIAPPSGAQGTYQSPFADVKAGSQTYATLQSKVSQLPFNATVVHSGATVSDLNF